MRLERRLDDCRVGVRPRNADEHADVARARRARSGRRGRRSARAPTAAGRAADSPSNFVVSAKSSVSHGRLTPCPSTSVATQTSAAPVEEAVDLLAARRERHRAVEHRDAVGPEPVDLAGEREHGLAAERDDDRARRERPQLARADELERQLPLEDAELGVRERVPDERQRVERAEQEDVAVLAGEQQPRPRRAALLVVRPLHLVEHEHLARARRHLDRAADDRGVLVDALLAGDEADRSAPSWRREPAVRLLREHPQRPGVDAAPLLGEELRARRGSCRSSSARGGRRRSPADRRRSGSRISIGPSARFAPPRAVGAGRAGVPRAPRGRPARRTRQRRAARHRRNRSREARDACEPARRLDLQEAAQRQAGAERADDEADARARISAISGSRAP